MRDFLLTPSGESNFKNPKCRLQQFTHRP